MIKLYAQDAMYPESCEYLWWVSVSAKLRVMTRGEIETVNEDDVGCHVEFAQAGQTAWTFLNARTEVPQAVGSGARSTHRTKQLLNTH